MSLWTVSSGSATPLSIDQLKRHRVSLSTGHVTFRVPGQPVSDGYLFSDRQPVSLFRDQVTWFSGVCIGRKKSAPKDGLENHVYTIADMWWVLDHLPLLSQITIRDGAATAWQSTVVLGIQTGRNTYGTPLTVGQQITAILAYAKACGYSIGTGTINVQDTMIPIEVERATCAQAIQMCLRYTPDVVGFWTYQPSPLLSIIRRASLPQVSRQMQDFAAVEINLRQDLVPPCVVLNYKRVATVNGVAVTDLFVDAAPANSDGRVAGAIVDTIPINGAHLSFPKVKIRTTPIETGINGAGADQSRSYWGKKLGLLGVARATDGSGLVPDMTFYKLPSGSYFDIALANPTDANGEDPEANSSDAEKAREWQRRHPLVNYDASNAENERRIILDRSLSAELIEGQVTRWMSGVKAQKWAVTLMFDYQPLSGKRTDPMVATVKLTATNATNREYCQLEDSTPGEVPPIGVAAQLLAALSVPHFTGTAETVIVAECDGALGPGACLNIQGGSPDWGTMKAVIQESEEDIDRGVTRVTVGPPEQLGPQDYIALLQRDRSGINSLQRFGNVRTNHLGRPE